MSTSSLRQRHAVPQPEPRTDVAAASRQRSVQPTDEEWLHPLERMHPWLLHFASPDMEQTCRTMRFEQSTYPSMLMSFIIVVLSALCTQAFPPYALHFVPGLGIAAALGAARFLLAFHPDQLAASTTFSTLTLALLPCGTASLLLMNHWADVAPLNPPTIAVLTSLYGVAAVAARLDHTPALGRYCAHSSHVLLWLSASLAGSPAMSTLGVGCDALLVLGHLVVGDVVGWPLERQARRACLLSSQMVRAERRALEAERLAMELRFRLDTQEEVLISASSIRSQLGLAQLEREIRFESLTILEKVGQGGFGVVYHALCRQRDGRSGEVALKQPSRACSKRDLERFVREISTMEALSHPNIVRIVGSVWRPSIMLVLEWMPGGSLHVALAQGRRMDEERVALDVARGMRYLHSLRFCHRDLKAANVLLSDDCTAKIGDFGLSSQLDAYETLKCQAGTPLWTAPEVQLGKRAYDERCDLYSYAILTLEVADFHYVHGTLLTKQAVRALCHGWRPDAISLRHVRLLWLVHACWVHDPRQRPPFGEIVAMLDESEPAPAEGRGSGAADDDDAVARHACAGNTRFAPFNLIDRITLPPMAPMSAFSPLSANSYEARSWAESMAEEDDVDLSRSSSNSRSYHSSLGSASGARCACSQGLHASPQ